MLMHRPDPAELVLSGVRLGRDAVLLVWHAGLWQGRFRPTLDGVALRPPLLGTALVPGERQAGLLRLPRRVAADARLRLGAPEAGAPGLGLADLAKAPAALLDLVPEQGQAGLLQLLLEAGSVLFDLAEDPPTVAAIHALAEQAAATAEAATPIAAGPDGLRLLRIEGAPPRGMVHLVGRDRVRRLPSCQGATTHLLVEDPRRGELLVASDGWLRRIAPAAAGLPAIADLAAQGPEAQAIRLLVPAALAGQPADPARTALLRTVEHVAPARPRSRASLGAAVTGALELALRDGAGGIFLRGWLRDPHGLVTGMTLGGPGEPVVPVPEATLFRFPRRELGPRFQRALHAPGEAPEGFVAHLPAAACGPQPDLTFHLAGGGAVTVTPGLRWLAPAQGRDLVLASVRGEALSEAMFARCLAPAAARLHAAHLARPRTPVVKTFGTPARAPQVSVLIPLYCNLGFLRMQLAAFAADPEWREAETILVLDSPEQAAEVEHLLRGIALMHGLPLTLVVPPRNLGYAAANNLGAGVARGKMLLLLNSDVVPDQPGWLATLAAAAAAKGRGAAGPKLLFEDGSIQHAGLYFERDGEGRWLNRHYYKGFPRHYGPATLPRAVPGVTGATLMVRRALFERVGGFTEDYILGDYEDSDLCLKLRRAGASIAYEPGVELWHFERRSVGLHGGYTGTLAAQYNRGLHHDRWDGAIGVLMRRFAA